MNSDINDECRRLCYTYEVTEELMESEELGDYVTFGIAVYSGKEEVMRVRDVSTDLDAVRDLAERCTSGELAPVHLFDVIEDFLAEV